MDLEAHLPQPVGDPRPGRHDLAPGLLKICRVPHGRLPCRLGQPVQGVGVEGVLHAVYPSDQVLAAQGVADPHPRQGPGLGHGADHQQVGILVDELHSGLGPEVGVGLVYQHRRCRVVLHDPPDVRQRQGPARGCVGVADHRAAVPPQKALHRQGEVLVEGDLLIVQPEQLGIDRIEAVCDVWEHHLPPGAEQGVKAQPQHLV